MLLWSGCVSVVTTLWQPVPVCMSVFFLLLCQHYMHICEYFVGTSFQYFLSYSFFLYCLLADRREKKSENLRNVKDELVFFIK